MPRITTLERYILRECLTPFFLAVTVVTAILFMGMSFKLLTQTKGLDLVAILPVAPHIIPYVIVYVMPIALLVGTVSAYSRLTADHEIQAMKLTGVPATRMITPTLFLGLFFSFLTLMSANYLGPQSRYALKNLARRVIVQIISQLSESRNSFVFDGGKGSKFEWKFHWQDVRDGKLHDLVIQRTPREENLPSPGSGDLDAPPPLPSSEILYARSGSFRLDPYDNMIKFELEGLLGYYDFAGQKDRPARDEDDSTPENGLIRGQQDRKLGFQGRSFAITINLNADDMEDDLELQTKDRDIDNLMALFARNVQTVRKASRASIHLELGRRIAESLCCLSFALLGAAVGLLFRGPNRILAYLTGFVVALAVYFPLTRVGEQLGDAGTLPPEFSLQFGNMALVLIAFVLLRRGVR